MSRYRYAKALAYRLRAGLALAFDFVLFLGLAPFIVILALADRFSAPLSARAEPQARAQRLLEETPHRA